MPDHESALFETLRSIGKQAAAKPIEPQETEVVEGVGHDVENTQVVGVYPQGKVTLSNLFRHPDAHPIVLDLMLIRKYGPEWLDWEPETLEVAIPHDFATGNVSDVNLTKINACKTLHLLDSFWERWEVFNWCTAALNGIFPDAEVLQVPTVAQVLVAVDNANRIRDDVAWSEEIRLFIQTVFRHDNILVPIPPVEFVESLADDALTKQIDERWDAVRAAHKAPGGDTVVDEQLRRMLTIHQFLEESRTRLRHQMELVPHA